MTGLHLVQYDNLRTFMDAMRPFDDNGTNMVLGPVCDRLGPLVCGVGNDGTKVPMIFMVVWKDKQAM